jgi:oxygen-independent coproporphyrinogen-3 oxidase
VQPIAIYIHIPFCAKHCAYCDFNTYVEQRISAIVPETVDAICADVRQTAERVAPGMQAQTVFFGGGTPTFLSGSQLAQILGAVREAFGAAEDAEISAEANPGASDAAQFREMRDAGFNRLSIGVQSFDDAVLQSLDRFHTAREAEEAVRAARSAGFDNLSLDLMFRLPGQDRAAWSVSLERAAAIGTEHLSLYSLTLEPGTRFERLAAGGRLVLPDEETELAMYEEAVSRLADAGFEHYEVSNFARPGRRCRHNMVYWRNGEYLGFGPGAVSYLAGRRWRREPLPSRYVRKMRAGEELAVQSEHLDPAAALGETIMLGLRLREGISLAGLRERFGIDVLDHYADEIRRLSADGLMERNGDRLRLTHSGLLVGDSVCAEFLA